MKRYTLVISVIIVTLFIAGCKSKNNPDEAEVLQTIVLYAGDTATLDDNGGKAVNYISDNEFVAAVDNDKVIARHIGSALLTTENRLYNTEVTVLPRYRFFQEPITAWGMDTTSLIDSIPLKSVAAFGLDSAGVRTMIAYLRVPNLEATLYYFEDNRLTLTWSLIPQKDSILTHMEDFLSERYEYMNSKIESTFWSDAMVHRYMDAYSPKDASIIVGYHDMILDENSGMVEYMFGTRNLLGLVYQDAQLHGFDTAWIEGYVNGLPSRLLGGN